jgi:hypothetical protein
MCPIRNCRDKEFPDAIFGRRNSHGGFEAPVSELESRRGRGHQAAIADRETAKALKLVPLGGIADIAGLAVGRLGRE